MDSILKEAMHYKKIKKGLVQCGLCPHFCTLKNSERGKCGVRENREGKLYSLVYARLCAVNIDPIEKKPMYHFLPGSLSYSIGTAGCNLFCKQCQNYNMSRGMPEEVASIRLEPEQVVENAKKSNCQSISYTYNEPTIFYEYVLETAKLARKKRVKNVTVTNAYMNMKPLKELYKYVDGANVDLKSFNEDFYKKICGARLKPVLESLKAIKKIGVWLEVTNLVIPGYNDRMGEIRKMCEWIKKNLGKDTPLHFSRFYPCHKMLNASITPFETLKQAYETARNSGLRFVYLGNVGNESGYGDTFCPKCGERLIKRGNYFSIEYNKIRRGKCFKCDEKIAGVWG